MQQKTQRPVQFEITEQTREAVAKWIERGSLRPEDFLFPSRLHDSPHLSTRQYARIVDQWVGEIETLIWASRTGSLNCLPAPAADEQSKEGTKRRSRLAIGCKVLLGVTKPTEPDRW